MTCLTAGKCVFCVRDCSGKPAAKRGFVTESPGEGTPSFFFTKKIVEIMFS